MSSEGLELTVIPSLPAPMGDPNAPALDSEAILRALDRHLVEYVIVGGYAANIYDAARMTTDFDMVANWSDSNRDRLAAALRGFRFDPSGRES